MSAAPKFAMNHPPVAMANAKVDLPRPASGASGSEDLCQADG
jgi:hypothetical protein